VDNVFGTLGLIAELFTWIGFTVGGICLFILLILRGARGPWVETDAVLVLGDDATETDEVRWMSEDGGLHAHRIRAHEREEISDPEQLRIFYSKREPHIGRLEARTDGERVLRLLSWVLLGVGAAAVVLSLVLLIVEQ